MPQYRQQQSFDGYVNPAHLYTSLPIVYDQDVTSPQLERRSMDEVANCHSYMYDHKADQSWDGELSMDGAWQNDHTGGTPSIREDGSGSSASNSPSPGNGSTQQTQNHKRRAQNRAAQRAYRDRKMRYLLDLQSGIQEIEHKIRRLQGENTELIRQLCETRAANNDLRETSRSKEAKSPQPNDADLSTQAFPTGPAEAWSKANFTGPATGELEALYEPFAAMWNLIHLDPSVVRGTVSAQTVLERLRAMVEFSGSKAEMQVPRSYSTSHVPNWSLNSFSSTGTPMIAGKAG